MGTNGNFFLINAHGVLRRMGAVTEIPGMPQLTIAERQFLVLNIILKVIDMDEIMNLWSCPKYHC